MSSAAVTRARARGYAICNRTFPYVPPSPAVRVFARPCVVSWRLPHALYRVEDTFSLDAVARRYARPTPYVESLFPVVQGCLYTPRPRGSSDPWGRAGAMRAMPRVRAEMAPAVALRGRVLLGVQKKSARRRGSTRAENRRGEPAGSRACFPVRGE